MNRFEEIKWPNQNSFHVRYSARCASGMSFKNCYIGFGATWVVKVFLGGGQRLLCTTHSGVTAARFADMAILYFHPYRKRKIRPLMDTDMNFTVAEAEAAMTEVPEAKQFLVDYERRLIASHLLPPLPEPPPGEPPMRDEVLRESLHLQHQKMGNLFAHFKSRFKDAEGAGLHIDMFEETLSNQKKMIRSFDTFFLSPKPETDNNQPTEPNATH